MCFVTLCKKSIFLPRGRGPGEQFNPEKAEKRKKAGYRGPKREKAEKRKKTLNSGKIISLKSLFTPLAAVVQLNYVGYGIGMVPESGPGYH